MRRAGCVTMHPAFYLLPAKRDIFGKRFYTTTRITLPILIIRANEGSHETNALPAFFLIHHKRFELM